MRTTTYSGTTTRAAEIEATVMPIVQSLWRAHRVGNPTPEDPITVLNPVNVATLLSATLEEVSTISGGSTSGTRTAGMLDRVSRHILVSTEFPPAEMRFTAAHEIGHLVLHDKQLQFRDRPMTGLPQFARRPPIEAEADVFAACLLMPRNLVYEQFQRTFGVRTSFVFDEAWAFWLAPSDPESLLDSDSIPSRALAMAKARHFNGRPIRPLHEQFRVSASAMAYRLIELGLTGKPEFVDAASSLMVSQRAAAPLFTPGLHPIAEHELEVVFASPFVRSSRRSQLVESLRRFLTFVRQTGINCDVWIDGSFATDKLEPNDIDVVVFIYSGELARLSNEAFADVNRLHDRALMMSTYCCDVYVDRADDEKQRNYYLRTFGRRDGVEKGIPVVSIVR